MTNEEASWLAQFDKSYNSRRTEKRFYKEDTMRRIRVDSGEPIENIEEFVSLLPTQEMDNGSRICLTPSSRGVDPKATAYSPRDYWALPSLWYSENWVDKIIWMVDSARGEVQETGIPGIIIENGYFKVFSFFRYENVCIGEYVTLERAKQALTKHNQTVTQRGWSVDYV
jgi:hypothetical protein